jgi:hypothetical protein
MRVLTGSVPPDVTLSPHLARLRDVAMHYLPATCIVTIRGKQASSEAHVVSILVRHTDDRRFPPALIAESTNMVSPFEMCSDRKQQFLKRSDFMKRSMDLMDSEDVPESLLFETCTGTSGADTPAQSRTRNTRNPETSASMHWYHNVVTVLLESGQYEILDKDKKCGMSMEHFMNNQAPMDIIRASLKREYAPFKSAACGLARPPSTAQAPWFRDFASCCGLHTSRINACEQFLSRLTRRTGALTRKGVVTLSCGYWSLCANLAEIEKYIHTLQERYPGVEVAVHDVDFVLSDCVRRVSFLVQVSVCWKENIKARQTPTHTQDNSHLFSLPLPITCCRCRLQSFPLPPCTPGSQRWASGEPCTPSLRPTPPPGRQ